MILFESILTTFKSSVVFRGSSDSSEIGLSLKSNHHQQIGPSDWKSVSCMIKANLFSHFCRLFFKSFAANLKTWHRSQINLDQKLAEKERIIFNVIFYACESNIVSLINQSKDK